MTTKTLKKIVMLATITILITSTMTMVNTGSKDDDSMNHYDILLSNEQLNFWYTDEAAAVGMYTDDRLEPDGWTLEPILYWDTDGNGFFGQNESMGTTIFPTVHFTTNGQDYTFSPLHQSIMQQPGDAAIVSAGWVSQPNVYASKVKDANSLITIKNTVSIFPECNYFAQTIDVSSTAVTLLTDVNLQVYVGMDINGFFDDCAFIDTDTNNMIKAKDNTTGIWFGAFPVDRADAYEISTWNDGPSDAQDLWQHIVTNTVNGQQSACGDVEGALSFNLPDLPPASTSSITIVYSFGVRGKLLFLRF